MIFCLLRCLYLSAGLAAADHLPVNAEHAEYADVRTPPANPYGILEAGWMASRGRWDLELAARHFSSPTIDMTYGPRYQRGMDTAEIRVKWFPFR
jgi:hypothetical protein